MTSPLDDPATLFEAVAAASPGLRHPDALRTLFAAALPARADAVRDAAFKAKFLMKLSGILQRTPVTDASRDQLAATFRDEMIAVRDLLAAAMTDAPEAERTAFTARYLAVDPAAFGALLEFLRDLQWVQNVALDNRA